MAVEWHPQKFNSRLHKRTVQNLWKAAFLVERDQKIIATEMGAVDTGRLRSSIVSSVDERLLVARVGSSEAFLRDAIIQGEAGPSVYYAIFVVMGVPSKNIQPRDFMTAALDANRANILKLIRDI